MRSLLLSLLISTLFSAASVAQCNNLPYNFEGFSPDTIYCAETGVPFYGVYDFRSYDLVAGVTSNYIIIDSLTNLPPGISYTVIDSSGDGIFSTSEPGCITLQGTTNGPAGYYDIGVYVTWKLSILPNPISGELEAIITQVATGSTDGFDGGINVVSPGGNCASSQPPFSSPCTVTPSSVIGLSQDTLPCAQRNVPYEEILQFQNYTTINIAGALVTIDSMKLLNLQGAPNGLALATNKQNDTYIAGEFGCVTISGTTLSAIGDYNIDPRIRVWVTLGGTSNTIDTLLSALSGNTLDLEVVPQGAACNYTNVFPPGTCGPNYPSIIGFTPNDTICAERGDFSVHIESIRNFGIIQGITVEWMTIDSIVGLPDGISYIVDDSTGDGTFSTLEPGCIQFAGTSNDSIGDYKPEIFITMKVTLLPNPISGSLNQIIDQLAPGNTFYNRIVYRLTDPGANCAISFSSGISLISGSVFFDQNANGLKDSGDIDMANQMLTLTDTSGSVSLVTNSQGLFARLVNNSTYVLSLTIPASYQLSSSPATYNLVLSNDTSVSGLVFGITPTNPMPSVQVNIDGNTLRPGFYATQWLTYENTGTTVESGTITYCPDDSLSYISSTVTPDAIVNGCYKFDFTNLFPGQTVSINIRVRVPPNVDLLGDTLCSTANVDLTSGVNNSIYATDEVCITVLGAYDPNDKQVLPDLVYNEDKDDAVLAYRIRFQNTGTDTAFNIVVRDTISPFIDINSIEMVASSHNYQLSIEGSARVAVWTFANVLLPDSNVNEPGSHGYIKFRASLVAGVPDFTTVPNRAGIFFDFNPPIITNYAELKLDEPNSIRVSDQLRAIAFPNPNNGSATIQWAKELNNFEVSLFDISGKRLLFDDKLQGNSYQLQMEGLAGGIYYYQISQQGQALGKGKLVVME